MSPQASNAFVRFLLSGAFNTGVTYALYLALLLALPYWLSYTVAYAAGIVLAYALSRHFVFGTALSGRRMLAFPFVYVLQYLVGLAVAYLWVGLLHLPAQLAPLAALCVTIPMTFLLSRKLFQARPRTEAASDPAPAPAAIAPGSERWQKVAVLILPSLLIVALLWLPFGTSLRGLIEEWDVLGLFTVHGVFFLANADSPLYLHSIRPLTVLPQAIAYALDPDSFAWWHVILAGTLVLKGGAAALLGWLMLRSARWAMAFGALVLLYPADTMQLAFRGMHINVAVALVLLASALLVIAHDTLERRRGIVLGAAAAVLLAVAALMYEASLALVPLPLLVLVTRDGFAAAIARLRMRLELSALWLAGAATWLVNLLVATGARGSYQGTVAGTQLTATLQQTVPKLFSVAITRALMDGWLDALRMLRAEYASYIYVIAAAAACCLCIVAVDRWLFRQVQPPPPADSRRLLRLALCGLVALVLGYAPYLLSISHVLINQRTYLFATPGAAMVVLAVLLALAARWRALAASAAAVLILLGFSAQAFQFRHYISISETQRGLLREIVENFDGELGGKTLLILDGSNRLNHTWMLRTNLKWALSYLYGKNLSMVHICLMPSHDWPVLDELGRPGECIEEPGGWRLRQSSVVTGSGFSAPPRTSAIYLRNEDLVILRIGEDGRITGNSARAERLRQLTLGSEPVAQRYRGVLLPPAWPSGLQAQFVEPPEGYYRWDFGRWWSMEQPIHGSGWRAAEWELHPMHQDASAWTVNDTATLVFELRRPGPAGVLGGQFDLFASEAVRNTLHFSINGQPLKHQWLPDNRFFADIPPGTVREGSNIFEVHAPVAPDYYGLAARLTWFEVRTK